MNKTFISETVDTLYIKYGENISDLNILFPSKRARLFFNHELSRRHLKHPVWQPHFLSVDTLMEQISELKNTERLRLIAELYKVYNLFHQEPFDKFYFWGDMLLSDFDAIDNYMVDARMLFSNINDLKTIENIFDYISPEQKTAINRFWDAFSFPENYSAEQKTFLSIWNTLYEIYTRYKHNLQQNGFGYKGMIYRTAAEKLLSENYVPAIAENSKFAVIGFNALSKSEKILFNHLKEHYETSFFWDSDDYYTKDKKQEAGLFIRENIKLLGETDISADKNNFARPKEITIINSPSDSLQCKYVQTYLSKIYQKASARKEQPGKETAIVLTNESLLLPVLYSIPPEIEQFNVTSGYDLALTAAYSLTEYLIQLQHNRKYRQTDGKKETLFYHKDITGIINHPYIKALSTKEQKTIFEGICHEIEEKSLAYIPISRLVQDQFSQILFSEVTGTESVSNYLLTVLEYIIQNIQGPDIRESREYLFQSIRSISEVANTIKNCGLEISESIFLSSLRKHLRQQKISFEGEPLLGIQIMGILETRNLDFENVLILSVNEDTFPGIPVSSSFIPYNLRFGYGLPTLNYHEAMYSYYFYRLLQRAKNIHIVYCSKNEEIKSGEPSRFIHQLRLESPHAATLKEINLSLNVSIQSIDDTPVEKNERILQILNEYTEGKRALSASALYKYITCPYCFYLQYIERLKVPLPIEEEIDSLKFGTIMHECLEKIYEGIKDKPDTIEILKTLRERNDDIESLIDRTILQHLHITPEEYSGTILSTRYFIASYIKNIIDFDILSDIPFSLIGTEMNIDGKVEITIEQKPHTIRFTGITDRVDKLTDGTIRITDYKSGTPANTTSSVASLFDINNKKPNIAVFQALLYALFWTERYHDEVMPSLYFAKAMRENGYDNHITIGKETIYRFSSIAQEYKENLKSCLETLFSPSVPFSKTKNRRICEYCPYAPLCK